MVPRAIDVLLPTNDVSTMLLEAVDSIRDQRGVDARLIVVDDTRSSEQSAALRDMFDGIGQVLVVPNQGFGLVDALNSGLSHVETELCARMDADDICLPERLRLQSDWMTTHPDCVLVGGLVRYIDEAGALMEPIDWEGLGIPIDCRSIKRALADHNCIFHPTVMFRTDAVREIGGYRNLYPHNEDYDLWIRLSALGSMHNLPFPVLLYRLHEAQVGRVHAAEQEQQRTALLGSPGMRTFVDNCDSDDPRQWATSPSMAFAAVLVLADEAQLASALDNIAEQASARLTHLLIMGDFGRARQARVRAAASSTFGNQVHVSLARSADFARALTSWATGLDEDCAVFFFDSRDVSEPNRVSHQASALERNIDSWCLGQAGVDGLPRSAIYPGEYVYRSPELIRTRSVEHFRSNLGLTAGNLSRTLTNAPPNDQTGVVIHVVASQSASSLIELPIQVSNVRLEHLPASARIAYQRSRVLRRARHLKAALRRVFRGSA